jgi:threonine dehydrogenase-like Zn-dependent dehydrogenase
VDADGLAGGLAFACAMSVEERIARRLGPTVRIGLGASNGVPSEGRFVSFGIAGALRPGLDVGTVIDATRVVDERGEVLWEGGPLGIKAAQTGTILGASRIIDDPEERARLHDSSGADAVDMESGPLARAGRLAGCIRAISDAPGRELAGLAEGARPNGDVDYLGLARGFLRAPRETARAARDARRALKSLEAVA